MTQEYQISQKDFENLRKLCRTLNALVPKRKGFLPIPRHIITLEPIDLDDFFIKPELQNPDNDEFPIDALTPAEKNILFIETIVTSNLELLNKEYSEKFSALEDGDTRGAFDAHFEENLIGLISSALIMIQNILSSNICLRIRKRGILLDGDFSVRENFILVHKPSSDCEEDSPTKQTYVLVTAEDFEEITGQKVNLEEEDSPTNIQ